MNSRNHRRKFEDLETWKMARQLVNSNYALTREGALVKDFGLTGQIQRAAVSVISNVAEGFERQHSVEKIQAYNIARASAGEVRSLLYVIQDNYPASADAVRRARDLVVQTGSLVSGLIASTKKRAVAKWGGTAARIGLLIWTTLHCVL